MNKKIPALFDSDSSAKKRARSPQPKKLNSPRGAFAQPEVTNIRVFALFRPFNKQEDQNPTPDFCSFPDNSTVLLNDSVHTFDRVFSPTQKQHLVYDTVGRDAIQDVLDGYNSTIFAYGQTGSGKTYTMFGELRDPDHQGIIPRSIESIFSYINKSDSDSEFVLTCSMLEIYKETLYDLLSVNRPDLRIKESATRGIYVEGLTQISLQSEGELLRIVEVGEQTRKVAATRINQYSSRSHTIFMLEIKQKLPNEIEKKGKLNLVDLAGSEKVGKTGAQGEILEEAKKINLSLSCLGNVIHALTTNNDHIPYRNSKLTRILQESLGGNYKTSLIVTCSSHATSYEETLSTLKFASRAKSIKNHFKMNVKMSSELMQQMIRDLKQQLMIAHQEIEQLKKRSIIDIPNEDNQIRQYDSRMLSHQEKSCFKHKSFQSTPSVLTDIQKNIDLSFFSSKKASQAENLYLSLNDQINQMRDNETGYQKQIEDLRMQLNQTRLESQKQMTKLQHQQSKIDNLEKVVQQKGSIREVNKILLDEIRFLNEQLSLVNNDQDEQFNNVLKDKLESNNIEYARKLELILNDEMGQSKVTKVINKNHNTDEVMQKLSLQNLLSILHKIVITQVSQIKMAPDIQKRISESIEESLRNPQIEQSLRDYMNNIEPVKKNVSEEKKIHLLTNQNEQLKKEFLVIQEQLQQLGSKNEKLIEALKRQNLNFFQHLQQQFNQDTQLISHTSVLAENQNYNTRPISQQSEKIPKSQTRKPSTFFRYEDL